MAVCISMLSFLSYVSSGHMMLVMRLWFQLDLNLWLASSKYGDDFTWCGPH